MRKDKKNTKYRPGPLFTKIPGASKPKKSNSGPLFTKIAGAKKPKKVTKEEPICKQEQDDFEELLGIGVQDTPVIDLTDAGDAPKMELDLKQDKIKVDNDSTVDTSGLYDTSETFDVKPSLRKVTKKETHWTDSDDSDFDSKSRDSFEENFVQPKQPKTSQKLETDEGTVPGFKRARAVKHKYQYNPNRPGGPKTIPCQLCNQKFNQTPGHPENFSNHLFNVHATPLEEGKYGCKVCNHIARDKKAFRNHFNSHRILPKPKQCPICGFTFTEYSKWRSHTHRDRSVASKPLEKRQFACELCGKICATRPSLAAHQINIHQQLGRKCRWCPKIVPYDEWDEHKKMEKIKHNVNTNVTCNICGAVFTSKDSAANHRRNFHRDRPELECDICHKTFKCSTYLSQHKTNTHGERRFQCVFCAYRSSYKYLVTLHLRKKHNYDPEEINDEMIIEHELGSVPPRDVKPPVAKYRSKQKKSTTTVSPAIPQNLDAHTAAMWAFTQKNQLIREEQDQSSNSNY